MGLFLHGNISPGELTNGGIQKSLAVGVIFTILPLILVRKRRNDYLLRMQGSSLCLGTR